ncbi:MAG: methyltransferase domain-containing protein [Desulfosalsimonadaceae bacterium]
MINSFFVYPYLMESEKEVVRMNLKTDPEIIRGQAEWAGVRPGMRIADIGCGPGITTSVLGQMARAGGEAVGVDFSRERIEWANMYYADPTTRFLRRDIQEPLDDLGSFDFIWVRFLLEYFRSRSFDIVKKLAGLLNPGGILCLIDLDLNCLNHYGLPQNLENSLKGLMKKLEETKDFDPYAGRRLYSFLYDLNFDRIDVDLSAHHLIFGKLHEKDEFNWITKAMVAARNSGYNFYNEFSNGFAGFYEAFIKFFLDPRRFTYTPVIACAGRRPPDL